MTDKGDRFIFLLNKDGMRNVYVGTFGPVFIWIKSVFVSHWLPFGLLAVTWFFGYDIQAHTGKPAVALYYVMHVFAGCGLFAAALFYLHPGKDGIAPHLISADPHEVSRAIHRIFFYLIAAAPVTGVLVFFVPDSNLHWSAGSFWTKHVYSDNLAHLVHGLQFYVAMVLGVFDFLYVLNKRRQG